MSIHPNVRPDVRPGVRPAEHDPAAVVPSQKSEATQEWEVILDRLEIEVLWAERLLSAARPLDPSGWQPQEPEHPLPEHLLDRAKAIHERQLETIQRLVQGMRKSTQQQAYVASAIAVTPDGPPRYLDVAG